MCDYPEFYSVRNPTARKDRKCQECGGVIAKGEKYTYVAGKWEGDFSTFADCNMCEVLRHYCQDNDLWPEDGSDPDCGVILSEHLHEAVGQFPEIPIDMIPPMLLKYRNENYHTSQGVTPERQALLDIQEYMKNHDGTRCAFTDIQEIIDEVLYE